MSPPSALVCAGAPRDLGLDQGRHAGEAVRAEVAAVLGAGGFGARLARALRRDPQRARIQRDTTRFFPHMAERAEGIARGAGVTTRDLTLLLAREHEVDDATLVGVRSGTEGRGVLIALASARAAPFLLRRSEPDNDYRSLEIALPWRVPALAGVNERGLAVAASARPARSASREACAASALLLAQDCLQRFDRVDKAIEWCERRPAGGCASLLMADAAGGLACVDVEGERRAVRRDMDGILLAAGDANRLARVEKALHASPRRGVEDLHRILATPNGRVVLVRPEDPDHLFGDPVAARI